jgi:hypothetical protein
MLKNRSRHTLGNLWQVFPFSLSFFFPNLLLLPRAGVGTIAPPSCPNPSFHPWSSTRVWQRASISPLLALTQKVDVVCTTPLHFLDTLRHQPDLRYMEDRLRLNSLLTPPLWAQRELGPLHTMAVQDERPLDWVAKLCWESKEMGWK